MEYPSKRREHFRNLREGFLKTGRIFLEFTENPGNFYERILNIPQNSGVFSELGTVFWRASREILGVLGSESQNQRCFGERVGSFGERVTN